MKIEITKHETPSPTMDYREDSLDSSVRVTRDDGTVVDVDVTLLRSEHSGDWATWGPSPDMWLSNPQQFSDDEIDELADLVTDAAQGIC